MKFRVIVDPAAEEEVVATVHSRSALTEQIESLVLRYAGKDRLIAHAEDGAKILPFSQIELITVIEGKIWAIDGSGRKYRLRQRLYEIEDLLPDSFIRINKSSIANERRIDQFTASFSGAVDVIMKCGYREYVSRRCFAAIRRRYRGT